MARKNTAAFGIYPYQSALECIAALRDANLRYEGRIKNGGILVLIHADNSEWTRSQGHLRAKPALKM
jgi:hypothetical protein